MLSSGLREGHGHGQGSSHSNRADGDDDDDDDHYILLPRGTSFPRELIEYY